jgi:predicted RNA binding protein YcfA (HicA-like mRNA interferase family)
MGRLAGLSASEVIRKLRRAGFVFDRVAKGSHEIWLHPETRARVVVPHHPGDVPEGTVRAIIRQAGLEVDEFLKP